MHHESNSRSRFAQTELDKAAPAVLVHRHISCPRREKVPVRAHACEKNRPDRNLLK